LLYRSAKVGRLTLRRHPRGWEVDDRKASVRAWKPAAANVFVGRDDELAAIERAITEAPGARVAVVAVQGMAGVGKSFLVEQFCVRHRSELGVLCRWVLDPMKLERAEFGLLAIAQQAGIDCDRTPIQVVPSLLVEHKALVHIDNVDSAEAAEIVVDLLDRLSGLPAVVTGRYAALGTTPGAGWVRVEVECLDLERSVDVLRAELEGHGPADADLRELATALGGLPLALHLAAGYLRRGASVAGFLERLSASGLGLKPDRADPLWQTRSRGIVAASFEISKQLFLAEASSRSEPWSAALAALGWSPPGGVGRELGAAIAGLSLNSFEELVDVASSLSLVRRVPTSARPDGAWSVHPLLAEFLRADIARADVNARVRDWVIAQGHSTDDGTRAARWGALSREAAVHAWLATTDGATLSQLLPRCWPYAASHGTVGPWLEAARRACHGQRANRTSLAWAWGQLARRVHAYDQVLEAAKILETDGEDRSRALSIGLRADVFDARGDLDEALRIRREEELPAQERLRDARAIAMTKGKIADALQHRGELEEALRIRREEQLPAYERFGDERSIAMTRGKIAGILHRRGELDEALRIHREEELPVYERLGELREKAATMGHIADIHEIRGELDEALRIRRVEQLPIYERIGDVRSRAVAMGNIADIHFLRGELDDALRIRREDELPVYEQLGDIQSKAVTLGQIADILKARGEFDEALQIYRAEQLPVYERLGDVRAKAVTMDKIAGIAQARGNLDEAMRIHIQDVLPVYDRLGDVQARAVTMTRIAEIFQLRGDLAEALRINRDEILPVCERRGGRDLVASLANVGTLLIHRGRPDDLLEARSHIERAERMAQSMHIPFPEHLSQWLASEIGRTPS
jgi:tetratricopeptide (TPR) repeat protein